MIEIEFDLDEVKQILKEEERAIALATRHATNQALKEAKKKYDKDLEERYDITKDDDSWGGLDDLRDSNKITLGDLRSGFATADISANPDSLSLMDRVVNEKKPTKVKGIPVRRRRPTMVSVAPGRMSRLKKSFLAKPSSRRGGVQVFSKSDTNHDKLIKRTLPNALSVLERERLQERMYANAEEVFEKEFHKKLDKELDKIY